jgi:hypothetical protein
MWKRVHFFFDPTSVSCEARLLGNRVLSVWITASAETVPKTIIMPISSVLSIVFIWYHVLWACLLCNAKNMPHVTVFVCKVMYFIENPKEKQEKMWKKSIKLRFSDCNIKKMKISHQIELAFNYF